MEKYSLIVRCVGLFVCVFNGFHGASGHYSAHKQPCQSSIKKKKRRKKKERKLESILIIVKLDYELYWF